MPVAPDLRELARSAGAVIDDVPHARDHALEEALPFLQRVCPDRLEILPVAVGRTAPGEVASFLAKLDALLVVSTDLSHHHPDARAREIDRRTANAVVDRDARAIADAAACGVFALRGLVEYARRHGLRVEVLALRTSADTAGDRASVVGYGAFAFFASKSAHSRSVVDPAPATLDHGRATARGSPTRAHLENQSKCGGVSPPSCWNRPCAAVV